MAEAQSTSRSIQEEQDNGIDFDALLQELQSPSIPHNEESNKQETQNCIHGPIGRNIKKIWRTRFEDVLPMEQQSSSVSESGSDELGISNYVTESNEEFGAGSSRTSTRTNTKERASSDKYKRKLYTFVVRKSELIIVGVLGTQVLTANHKDHFHFVFESDSSNSTRTFNRICDHFNFNIDDVNIAKVTKQHIRNIPKFMAYILRYGVSSYQFWGKEVNNNIWNKVRQCINSISNLEVIDQSTDCKNMSFHLREERKEMYEERANNSLSNKKQIRIDNYLYLKTAIQQFDVISMNHYYDKVPSDVNLELISLFGNGLHAKIKEQIPRYLREKCVIQNTMDWKKIVNPMDILIPLDDDIMIWIYSHYLNIKNEFHDCQLDNFLMLLACIDIILNKEVNKINSLLILGTSNSGKSLLVKSCIENLHHSSMTRTNSNNTFAFSDTLNKRVVCFEEPLIGPEKIDMVKLMFGGESTTIPVKYNTDEELERTPFLITSNKPIDDFCKPEDREALANRMYIFKLDVKIGKHNDVINIPPGQVKGYHITSFYKFFEDEINVCKQYIITNKLSQ